MSDRAGPNRFPWLPSRRRTNVSTLAAAAFAKGNAMAKTKNPTLYLTELDVTRLEAIASRAGTAELDEMLDALLERAAIVMPSAIPKDVVTMNSRVVCALFFASAQLVVNVTMLNALIAIMGDTYRPHRHPPLHPHSAVTGG